MSDVWNNGADARKALDQAVGQIKDSISGVLPEEGCNAVVLLLEGAAARIPVRAGRFLIDDERNSS